ncbi:MAG: tRNA (adenosine(37)-N6)-threonylcarbamoyltransferase complex ATPase subunit type 1 TsaE [Pseudomonadales bacterium]
MNDNSDARHRFSWHLPNEAHTLELGRALASLLDTGMVVYIEGELGAGKTTLCRGFLRELGVTGPVKSPTFTLVEPYETALFQVFHFDLYRLGDPNELEYMGIDDYFGGPRVCLIEWPERGEGFLPDCDLKIQMRLADQGREANIESGTERGRHICHRLETKKDELAR